MNNDLLPASPKAIAIINALELLRAAGLAAEINYWTGNKGGSALCISFVKDGEPDAMLMAVHAIAPDPLAAMDYVVAKQDARNRINAIRWKGDQNAN